MFNISLDDAAVEHIKALKHAGRQVGRALAYFSRAVANEVMAEVQRRGDVPGVNYDELEVAYFGKIGKANVSALVLPDSFRELQKEEANMTVVTVNPLESSEFLRELERLSPWPPTLLPPGFERTTKARLVSRRVTREEVESQVTRLLDDRDALAYMVRFGYVETADRRTVQVDKIMQRELPAGFRVQEDLAWKVLRHEFGLSGSPSNPHWRRAIKDNAVDLEQELLYGFWEIITGERREGIPRKNTSLMAEMKAVEEFQTYVTSRAAASRGNPRS